MGLLNVVSFILNHPLSEGRRLSNLVRFVRWQLGARILPGPVAVDFSNGTKLLVRHGMTGATGNVYAGLHDFEEMGFVLHLLRAGDLFVDVGANIGSYTILAASRGSHCIAFEPDAESFKWLLWNIGINDMSHRIGAHRAAVGDRNGQAILTVGLDTVNHVVTATEDGKEAQVVTMTTLDSALDGCAPIMIKIDVEGFENAVINGARATLEKQELCCVLMELAGTGSQYGFDEMQLRTLMSGYGFEECSYAPFKRRLVLGAPMSSNNALFVRNLPFVQERLKNSPPFTVMGKEL